MFRQCCPLHCLLHTTKPSGESSMKMFIIVVPYEEAATFFELVAIWHNSWNYNRYKCSNAMNLKSIGMLALFYDI